MKDWVVESEKEQIEAYIIKKIEKYFDEERDNDRLVLITRKGYWLFKHMLKSEKLKKLVNKKKVVYFTDRYVLKENYEWVEGKNIYIFDDTITNGNSMFFFYSIFRKHKAEKVVPLVFAVCTEFFKKKSDESKLLQYRRAHRDTVLSDDILKKKCEEEYNSFRNEMENGSLLTPDEIARLSIHELLWFQEGIEPMVMDLPVFRYKDAECKENIILSEEQYSKICGRSREWEFVKNTYNELSSVINCDFFQLYDPLLYAKFKNLFFNFVVKCKSQRLDDGRIQIVFIPFAMVRSSDFLGTWYCFQELLEGTEYYNAVYDKLLKANEGRRLEDSDIISYMKKNHNFCRGIYRALVFSLSNYIAYRFQEKIQNDIGIELFFDEEYLKDNSSSEFINTFIKEYKELNKESYVSKIGAYRFVCNPILNTNTNLIEKREVANINKIELYVRERILSTRYEKYLQKKKIVTIEALENELEQKFRFRSDSDKKVYLTKILILLLELSCSGNDIMVNNEDETIYRGFKAGENSEILMASGGKWVYPYVYAYYFYADEDFFKSNFDKFSSWIIEEFAREGFMNTVISSDNLIYFLRYFQNIEKEHLYEQIMSKCYLLDDYLKKKDLIYGQGFIENIFTSVFEWGDRVHGRAY